MFGLVKTRNVVYRYEMMFYGIFTFNEKEKSWFAGSLEHGQLGHAVAEKKNCQLKKEKIELLLTITCNGQLGHAVADNCQL